MSNPSLCGKINLVKEAKELYTVNEETLQSCNLNQKVSFYLEIEKLALRFIWKYKGSTKDLEQYSSYYGCTTNYPKTSFTEQNNHFYTPRLYGLGIQTGYSSSLFHMSVASAGRITGRRLESSTTFTHTGCLALGQFGLPYSMVARVKAACPKKGSKRVRKLKGSAEAILPFKTQPPKPCSVTSTVFCCSSHKLPLRFEREYRPQYSAGEVSKSHRRKQHMEWGDIAAITQENTVCHQWPKQLWGKKQQSSKNLKTSYKTTVTHR